MASSPPPPVADPVVAEHHQQTLDKMQAARAAGASWDQIHTSMDTLVQRAKAAGATDAQIHYSLGFNNPDEMISGMQQDAQQHIQATKPQTWTEAVITGLTHSAPAALAGVKPGDESGLNRAGQLTATVAQAVADAPISILGGVVGGVVGALGGAAVPGAGETGASEAAGGYVGGSAGAAAAPALIESVRDRYAEALKSGQVHNFHDFLSIFGNVMADTGKAAAVGVAAGGAGKLAGGVLDKIGAGKVTKFFGVAGSEAATMATASAALNGRVPTQEDFIDAAVTIGAFHVAHAATPAAMRAIRNNVMDRWAKTGEAPAEQAQHAVNDPVFRAKMLGQVEPKVPPGSAHTAVTPPPVLHPGAMTTIHSPLPSDVHVIPRAVGSFDQALPWMLKEEGGLTTDTGGLTKWGISSKANPDVDVKNLTQAQAGEIYHQRYWRAIDADALPPEMRLAAFDSAVNEGVGQTKTWLQQAHGDVAEFMKLRAEKYAKLARDPKYAPYAKSWAKRMRDLGAGEDIAGIVERGPDNVGKDFTPEDRQALDMEGEEPGGEGGRPSAPTAPPRPPEPEEQDPWKSVMGTVAKDEGTDWFSNSKEAVRRIYGELFDPLHPVRKLVDGVMKGDLLDDARNPNFLFRLAENSGEVSKWNISKYQTDLEGNRIGHSLEDIATGKSVGESFSKAEQKRFLDGYAKSKWALMMDERKMDSGVNIDHARQVVLEGDAKYGAAFQHLLDYRNNTLRWLGDGGIHAKDKVDKLIEENQAAMPGYRRMDDGTWQPVSTGKPGIWNPIKSLKGSERQTEPFLKSLMQETFLRHELAANNAAVNATADLGLKGNEATERRLVNFNIPKAIEALHEKGIDDDILSSLAKAAGSNIAKDEVPIFRDGKAWAVKFADPELTRVLRGYDQGTRTIIGKIASAITSVPRNMQTRNNPLFPLRLLTYDVPFQSIVNPDAKNVILNFVSGLGHMTGDSEVYQRWASSGAADHVFDTMSRDAYMKKVMQGQEDLSLGANMWNGVKSPFTMLNAWARAVSTPMKVGRYARGLAKGESPERAAAASSEAAFHRPGFGGPVAKGINSIIPYTTAHLNGLEKIVKAQLGIGSTVTGVKYNAAATTIKAMAILTVPAMLTWFQHKDEAWYKAMPDWQKDTAWFIIPPDGGRPAIPIAAPPILSAIYVAMPRRLMEAFVQDNPHALEGIGSTLGASLLPAQWLTGASILHPILEHMTNWSFMQNRPLVNQDTIQGTQPAEQYDNWSTPAARKAAQFLSDIPLISGMHLSPVVIDNYIHQWLGPMGAAAIKAAGEGLTHSANPRPSESVWDWPGISSWAVRYPSASAATIQQFYDTGTKLDQEHGSLQRTIRAGDWAEFKKIVDAGGASAAAYHANSLGNNPPPGVDVSQYMDYLQQAGQGADFRDLDLVAQAHSAMKEARKYSQNVWDNPALSSQDKRQMLDMANAQMQVIAQRGQEAADRARIGVKSPGAAARAQVPDSIQFQAPQ